MKLMPVYCMVISLLAGCGKQDILSHSSADSQVISGQVFVVTQGMNNIKLALVAVGAIPQEEFDQYLKVKQSNKLEKQQHLYSKYIEAKKHLIDAKENYNVTNNWRNVLVTQFNESVNPSEKSEKYIDKLKAELDKIKEDIDKTKSVLDEFEAFDKAEFLFEGLPKSNTFAKTDADGKFVLSLPKGKYVITANSTRSVGSYSEIYHWLVLFDAASPNQSLILSNDNFLETKCNECIKF